MKAVLTLLRNDDLAGRLDDIAAALRETVAMPRAAEAIAEAARRIRSLDSENDNLRYDIQYGSER